MKNNRSAGLGFLFFLAVILVFPVYADPPDDEPLIADELLIEDEPLIVDMHLITEELLPDEDDELFDENETLAVESVNDDDFKIDDESFFFQADPIILEVAPFTGPRSFNDVFPGLTRNQRAMVNSSAGLRYSLEKVGTPVLVPNPDSGVDLFTSVIDKKPSFIVEALALVPYRKRELDLLDIYNALGKIENIKNQSIPISGREYHVFTETTRLESARNRRPISDPLPADDLPYSDTMYLRFTDAGFGDLFIRADVSISLYGITYNMTNFRDVRLSFIPIMKAERVSIIIYLEPVKEGILIYSMSGFYLPALIAYSANLTPSINRRITVLLNWIVEGLRNQENEPQIIW